MPAFIALALLLLVAYALTSFVPSEGFGLFAVSDGDSVTQETAPVITQHIVSNDERTWPSGDRIWDCCRAIAHAEGYNVPNSVPARLNNPGDISDGANTFGSEFHSGSSVTTFPNATVGWQWLYTKIQNAVTGQSHVYLPTMSWYEIGAKWAPPNADAWAENVAAYLGVDPGDAIQDYILA